VWVFLEHKLRGQRKGLVKFDFKKFVLFFEEKKGPRFNALIFALIFCSCALWFV
jgi:hypothetical protein